MKYAKIFSHGIRRIPHLNAFLPEYTIVSRFGVADCVMGWGRRPTTYKACQYAAKHGLTFVALEDGFLRSLGLGVDGAPPLSLVVDDLGIYYDTTQASRLEQLILKADDLSPEILQDAEKAMHLIVQNGLSKYNHAPDFDVQKVQTTQSIVLLVDQTAGDMAIQYGGADEQTFDQMLQAAITENPEAEIWIKTHPDVLTGKKKGYFHLDQQKHHNVRFVTDDVNPLTLLRCVSRVYCVTSQMGFEALMLGKPVSVFGLPWYAGWGVTDDRHEQVKQWKIQNRRCSRSLIQLFAAAYLQYSRYLNPETGKSGTIFDVIDHLTKMRQTDRLLQGDFYCVGISLWKRAILRPFFKTPSCRLHFVASLSKLQQKKLPEKSRLLVWGTISEEVAAFAKQHQLPVWRMEDGFIRSVGLGSNLVPPLSLVVDDMGIYFDPRTPSRLEHILQTHPFTEHDLSQAKRMHAQLLQHAVSKYNVGRSELNRPDTDKTVLLVTGQVEDDASIRCGAPDVCRNGDLLQRVRQDNPDAFIIYKPHPDVVSGNRQGAVGEEVLAQCADLVLTEADVLSCIAVADEVHTMTSLSGFEALLRGKKVHCYGIPFYAGWGLTQDHCRIERRTRRLSVEALLAGTLLHYPLYVDSERRSLCSAFRALDLLAQQKQQKPEGQIHRFWIAKQWEKIQQLCRAVFS